MKYDYATLYEKNARFYGRHPRLKVALLWYNALIPYLFALGYALLLGYGFIELSPKESAALLFCPALALLIVSVLRIAVARPRPYEEKGAGIIPLREKKSEGKSFPSRHLASAGAIAVCFLPYFPVIGGALLALGGSLGYTRFAAGWHYPSDLIAGFLLGCLCGGLIFLF